MTEIGSPLGEHSGYKDVRPLIATEVYLGILWGRISLDNG